MNVIGRLIKNDKSPTFYQHYPELFSEYFPLVNSDNLSKLSEAGYLYYHSILLMDDLVDDKDFSKIPDMIQLQEQAIKALCFIYGEDSEFWKYWSLRREEYFKAVEIEKKLNSENDVSKLIYEDLAEKKSAFGKVAIDCLYVLSNPKDNFKYDLLLSSHKYFSVGFQLYDDVKDFNEDLKKGQFNWAIYQLKRSVDFSKIEPDNLNKLLFIKGIGQKILEESIENFQKAFDQINRIDCNGKWKDVITDTKQVILEYLDVTEGYIKSLEKRILLKNESHSNNYFFDYSSINDMVIKGGLNYIKHDFEHNYSDLKHIMYLSKIDGFENTSQVHVADIFQRAIINDCLIQISNKYNLDNSRFLNEECQYLIDNRNKDSIGGWSYFPSVKEIAADIDDLGQIIQVFSQANKCDLIDDYCTNAINIALSDRSLPDGALETWIINKDKQTDLQKKQELFNATKWGKGPDLEVVTNFVYSLYLYNDKFYSEYIEPALGYVASKQDEEGYWESRWYYGNWYGTYIVLRLLRQFEHNYSMQINKALNYIERTQNKDGGFGLNGNLKSDPLSTAFAILSIRLFNRSENRTLKLAEEYLVSIQNENGFWDEVDFIKPKLQEPYKSKTLTTAFVIRALCHGR